MYKFASGLGWLLGGALSADALNPDIYHLADDLQVFVSHLGSEERAAARLERLGVPPDKVTQALRVFEERVGRIREVRDPQTLLAAELRVGGWYGGPQQTDVYWPAFRDRLGFPDEVMA